MKGAEPWCLICSNQNGALAAAVPLVTGAEHDVPNAATSVPRPRSVSRGRKRLWRDKARIPNEIRKNGNAVRTRASCYSFTSIASSLYEPCGRWYAKQQHTGGCAGDTK